MKDLPTFSLKDPEGWGIQIAINADPYGGGVIEFAARWAALIEKEILLGKKLEDVAKQASHEADTGGITDFMYGCAVHILSRVWVYGEKLRQWHNIDVQFSSEGEEANESGGVLNPALVRFGI